MPHILIFDIPYEIFVFSIATLVVLLCLCVDNMIMNTINEILKLIKINEQYIVYQNTAFVSNISYGKI